MSSITSEQLNYLVYRYLTESGFDHTAFVFGFEARLNKSTIDGNMVPPTSLITLIQKGLRYLELEANLSDNDTDVDEDFSFISPFELLTKDANQLREIVKERRKAKQQEKESDAKIKPVKKKLRKLIIDDDDDEEEETEQNMHRGPTPMDIGTSSTPQTHARFPQSDVLILKGHTAEVLTCAWNPYGSMLASGSGDATSMIWTLADRSNNYSVRVLKHATGRAKEKKKDVTSINWNMDGTFLATGSYDGNARIWSTNGKVTSTLSKHTGPVFCIKWNKKGDYLLTGSFDKTAIVWDVKAADSKQPFKFHSGPVLDVDWRNNYSFASCSTDRMIYVCKIGELQPIKAFAGHEGEVNCVKWDPTGSLLASCSDDTTAKIWNMKQEKHIHEFRHAKEIFSIKWSPTGPGTSNSNKQLLLASASYDKTVSLWDVESGRLMQNLKGHRDCVYTLAFSPNGEYLASGSMDRYMNIWSVKEGKIIKTYPSNGGIFDVCWNKEGDRIAACTNKNDVCVLDFRM